MHLCTMVSKEMFFKLLRKYVHELFHGRLVHSTEFLTLFFNEFFESSDESNVKKLKVVADDWLDSKHLPKELISKYENAKARENELMVNLSKVIKWWKQQDRNFKKRKRKRDADSAFSSSMTTKVPDFVTILVTEQLVLLLERLLELNHLSPKTIDYLDTIYKFQHQSPDVQHRFAELIVKYRCTEKLSFVGRFLKYHQSMGIYLYGEMKISKSKHIKSYAVQIFKELQNEMDPTMAVNVKEILFLN